MRRHRTDPVRVPDEELELELLEVVRGAATRGSDGEPVILRTGHGSIRARLHLPADARRMAVWIGGVGGGLDGPASGLYPAMADLLAEYAVGSLRLDYRHPGDLTACTLDAALGVGWLHDDIAAVPTCVVGHSFGGAVAIAAGAWCDDVSAVIAMSSQTYGASMVSAVAPKPLLLIHGEVDEVLSPACSTWLYEQAADPKELVLLPGCGHGLDECRPEVMRVVRDFIVGRRW